MKFQKRLATSLLADRASSRHQHRDNRSVASTDASFKRQHEIAAMLRRPPTAIVLTTEDIIRYEEARQQKLAQAREASVESAKPAAKSKRAKDADDKAQRSASERIMGAGNSGGSR